MVRTKLISFIVIGLFFSTAGVAAEKMSFAQAMAERQALVAEEANLEQQWLANKEAEGRLEARFDFLGEQIPPKLGRLPQLKAEAETLTRNYEIILPELERQSRALEVEARNLEQDSSRYKARCHVTLPDPEYSQRLVECGPWFARIKSEEKHIMQELDQIEQEEQGHIDAINFVNESHDTIVVEIQNIESEIQSLLDQGHSLQTAAEKMLQRGLDINNQILQLDLFMAQQRESPCKTSDFRTVEDFQVCMSIEFDGAVKRAPAPWSPIDTSLGNPNR